MPFDLALNDRRIDPQTNMFGWAVNAMI